MDQSLNQNSPMEEALQSQPLAPMPRSITVDVLARIQNTEIQRPALLTWNDFVLSVVFAACLAALWFASLHLPPILLARLRIQGILLYQDFLVNSRWLIPALLFGCAAFFAALTIPPLYKMAVDHRR